MSLCQSSSTRAGALSSGSVFSGGIGGIESLQFREQNNNMCSGKLVMIAQNLISATASQAFVEGICFRYAACLLLAARPQQYAKIGRNASVSQVKSASALTYWVSFVIIDLRPACV